MRRVFIVLNCVVVAAACVVVLPAWVLAAVPPSYTSYGYASGVHTIAGSDAFPNFQNGAVNNRYPLAEVQQDASPSSTAVATYSDSGPVSATAGSQYNQGCANSGSSPPPPQICQNPNNQVPYARSTYPGGPQHSHIDACNGSGSCPDGSTRADGDAAQLNSGASGYYAGGGAQPFTGAQNMRRGRFELLGLPLYRALSRSGPDGSSRATWTAPRASCFQVAHAASPRTSSRVSSPCTTRAY